MDEIISVLLHYPNKEAAISTWESWSPENNFKYDLDSLRKMKPDNYILAIPLSKLDNLEVQVGLLSQALGFDPIIYMGCFRQDGSPIVWDAPNEHRNFSIEEYANQLIADVTIEEARNIQVEKINGWRERDLS